MHVGNNGWAVCFDPTHNVQKLTLQKEVHAGSDERCQNHSASQMFAVLAATQGPTQHNWQLVIRPNLCKYHSLLLTKTE